MSRVNINGISVNLRFEVLKIFAAQLTLKQFGKDVYSISAHHKHAKWKIYLLP